MYHPKYLRPRHPRRILPALMALGMILSSMTGSSFALLTRSTDPAVNTFYLASDPVPVVNESFSGTEKTNVSIVNSGEVSCYVRAAVTVNLVDADGHISARAPAAGSDYAIRYSTSWVQGSDGYWYYPLPVNPGGTTAVLIDSCVTLTDEYRLEVNILSQLIQARPKRAVQDAWGVSVDAGGRISK